MTDLTRPQAGVESTVTTPKNEETEVLELVNVKDEFEHEDEKPNVKKKPEEEEVKPIAMCLSFGSAFFLKLLLYLVDSTHRSSVLVWFHFLVIALVVIFIERSPSLFLSHS